MDKWLIRTPRLPFAPQPKLPCSAPVPPLSSNSGPTKSLFHRKNGNNITPNPPAPTPKPRAPTSSPPLSPAEPPVTNQTLEVHLPKAIYDTIPPTQVPTLLPIHDSTAYIEERVIAAQDGLAPDGNLLPSKLHYIIGWRDAPGPMISVEADRVLDYVSPYALEEFEYGLWKERRDAQRVREAEAARKEEEEKERAARASGGQGPAASSVAAVGKSGKGRGKKGRKGRPRKAVPQHPLVSDEFIQEEARRRAGDTPKKHKPSLSTPQKPRMAGLMAATSEEEEIQDSEMEEETSEDADAAIYVQLCAETGQGAWSSAPTCTADAEDVVMSDAEPPRKRIKSSSPFPKGEPGSRALTRVHTPRDTTPSNTHTLAPPNPAVTLSSLRNQHKASPAIMAFTPLRSTKRAQSVATSADDSRPSSVAASQSTTSSFNTHKHRKSIPHLPVPQQPATATEKKKRRRRRQSSITSGLAHQHEAEDPEQALVEVAGGAEWEVKHIEGMKHVRVDGRKARQFLVRWEGDWPPEMNPTWEPEENLKPSMVRKYLAAKNGGKSGGGGTDWVDDLEDNTWTLRRYSSVTEAFEDPGAAAANGGGGGVERHGDEDDDVDMDEETFQVTEGPVRGEGSRAGMSPDVLSREFDMAFPRAY